MQQQALPAATAQNIKKIALLLSRTGSQMPLSTLPAMLNAYIALLRQYLQIATANQQN